MADGMTAGARAVLNRRKKRQSASDPKLAPIAQLMSKWDKVRRQRYGASNDMEPAALDPTELSGWAGIPNDVLILVLKYCVTAVPYREVVGCTMGSAYGCMLYDNDENLRWSPDESREDDRMREGYDRGEPSALAYRQAWRRRVGASRGPRTCPPCRHPQPRPRCWQHRG